MALTIKFNSPLKGLIPEPEPVINHIPKAYKQLSNSVDSNTVKKCMPFLDAMISGYILPIPVDYRYTYNFSEQRAIFDTNTNLPEHLKKYFEIGFHDNRQISEELMYENRTINAVFKFINNWHIETPKGYSCLYTQPFNKKSPFKVIDGIVDTDNFFTSVNLPFYWTSPVEKEVIIKAGSPMCLIFPFRRESWTMKTYKKEEKIEDRMNFFREVFENYKIHSWKKKSYR